MSGGWGKPRSASVKAAMRILAASVRSASTRTFAPVVDGEHSRKTQKLLEMGEGEAATAAGDVAKQRVCRLGEGAVEKLQSLRFIGQRHLDHHIKSPRPVVDGGVELGGVIGGGDQKESFGGLGVYAIEEVEKAGDIDLAEHPVEVLNGQQRRRLFTPAGDDGLKIVIVKAGIGAQQKCADLREGCATARMRLVLPLPGGPCSSTPRR